MKHETQVVFAVFASILLVMVAPGGAATADDPILVESDSASGGWATTKPVSGSSSDITQDGSNNYQLVKNTPGQGNYYQSTYTASKGSGLAFQSGSDDNANELVDTRRSYNQGDKVEHDAHTSYIDGNNKYGGGADDGTNHYTLVAGKFGGCVSNDCWEIQDEGGNTLASGSGKQVDGMAYVTINGVKWLAVGDRSSPGTTSDDFLLVDPGDGSTDLVDFTSSSVEDEWAIGGVAQADQSGEHVWILDRADNQLELIEIESKTNINNHQDNNLPSEIDNPSGLARMPSQNGNDLFATVDEKDDILYIFDKNGNIKHSQSAQDLSHVGSLVRNGEGHNINKGAFYHVKTQYGTEDVYAIHDLSADTSQSWKSVKWDAGENFNFQNVDARVEWALGIEASGPVGNYNADIYIRTDETGWTKYSNVQTRDGQQLKSGTVDFSNVDWYQIRVDMKPGKKHPLDYARADYDNTAPCSGGGTCTSAKFYSDGGSDEGVVADQKHDFGLVEDYKWLNVTTSQASIKSTDDSSIKLEIVNNNSTVVATVADVEDTDGTFNISGTGDFNILPTEENETLTLRYVFSSGGWSSPKLESWEMTYDGENPEITSFEAEDLDSGQIYDNQTDFATEIGNTTEHRVEDVDQKVDYVIWYKNQEQVANKSGAGKFNYSEKWQSDETGVNTITAEVYNETYGSDKVTWRVDVPNPGTVQMAGVDMIRKDVPGGVNRTKEDQQTVDFPGDEQVIEKDLATLFDIVVDPGDETVTYDVYMNVTGPINRKVNWTNQTGKSVLTGQDTFKQKVTKNFDGRYTFRVRIYTHSSANTTSYDVRSIFSQQIADSSDTPDISQVGIKDKARVGQTVNISATAHSEISNMKAVWVEVKQPDGTTDTRAKVTYPQDTGRTVDYSESISFAESGTYEVTFVGQNYDGKNGTSTTYVVDVSNGPPAGTFTDPPLEVNANRSFTLNWNVTDPEGHAIGSSGVLLIPPSGDTVNLTGTCSNGVCSVDVPKGAVTLPENRAREQWAFKVWAQDEHGADAESSRTFVDVVSKQNFSIANVSVQRWDGADVIPNRNATVHAGRNAIINAEITPDISSTINGTVFVRLKTRSGSVEQELYTATGVELQNGTSITLSAINGEPVEERVSEELNGTYVIEIGVDTPKRDNPITYQATLNITGVTSGTIESTDVNKREVFPPDLVTITSTIRNDGSIATKYNATIRLTQNGSVFASKTVTSTEINPGDTGSIGAGFEIPKTVAPGEYNVEVVIESPTYDSWQAFDKSSSPLNVKKNRNPDIGDVDLTYVDDVVQGYVTIENDGNVPLGKGNVTIVMVERKTRKKVAQERVSIGKVGVGNENEVPINFNFQADSNTTYMVGVVYQEPNTSDSTQTQIATSPKPSMEIVSIDGPQQAIQGENVTYTISVKNNGEVSVDSTSVVVRLKSPDGQTVDKVGQVVDVTSPGQKVTFKATLDADDPALLGRSTVEVQGQASRQTDNKTLTLDMVPRTEDLFVTAPGFIISGDDSKTGVNPGDVITVTETFIVTSRPGAAIDVTLEYDHPKLKLVQGPENVTITSGSSLTWKFVVRQNATLNEENAIRVIAQSGDRAKAKDIMVSTVGSGGFVSYLENQDLSMGDAYTNMWAFHDLPTNTRIFIHTFIGAILALVLGVVLKSGTELSSMQVAGVATTVGTGAAGMHEFIIGTSAIITILVYWWQHSGADYVREVAET